MSDEGSRVPSQREEKSRLCPSCRCAISVLATKCRFCGEIVGRPKDETRQLTIDDLGGETIVHYAPSSNVMEALEAFRTEEVVNRNTPPPQKSSVFGFKSTPPAPAEPPRSPVTFAELNERTKALAALAMPTRPSAAPPANPTWIKKLAVLGGFIAAMVILYFGIDQGYAMWKAGNTESNTYVNGAIAVMARGGDPTEAHRLALEALKVDPSPANKDVADQARMLLIEQVETILNVPQITLSELIRASNLASQAYQIDRNPTMKNLVDKVTRETIDYSLRLVSSNPAAKEAELQLYGPNNTGPIVKVKQGGEVPRVGDAGGTELGKRFILELVERDSVVLRDTLRKAGMYDRTVRVTETGIPK